MMLLLQSSWMWKLYVLKSHISFMRGKYRGYIGIQIQEDLTCWKVIIKATKSPYTAFYANSEATTKWSGKSLKAKCEAHRFPYEPLKSYFHAHS